MSYRSLFLISVGINVILGVCIFQRIATRPALVSKQTATPSQSPIAPAYSPEALPTKNEGKRFDWESVEAPDYKQYIANLRAVGCPEETIRDIIEADVTKLYDGKKKQVRKEAPKFEYWKGDSFLRGVGREAWMKMYALDEERDKVLRDLGVQPDYRKRALKQQNANDWMLDFLSDDKKGGILRMRREFENALSMRERSSLDANEIKRLSEEHEAAVKRLLSPEEAFQYDLRMSPMAAKLRSEINAMDATEEEFIELYKLRVAHERELQPPAPNATAAARTTARNLEKEKNEKLQERIRQALGPERYEDYQMAQDWRYTSTYTFGRQVGLGSQEMKQLYLVRKEAEQAARQIQDSPALAVEARSEALQKIRQETERAMQAMLGPSGWEKYQSGGHGGWLSAIVRPQMQDRGNDAQTP